MLLVGAPYCTVRSVEPHSQSDDVKLQWEESVIGFNMSVRWQAAIRHGTRPRWLAGSMVDCGSCCVDAAPICWGCGLVETRGPIRAERRGQPRLRRGGRRLDRRREGGRKRTDRQTLHNDRAG